MERARQGLAAFALLLVAADAVGAVVAVVVGEDDAVELEHSLLLLPGKGLDPTCAYRRKILYTL